MNILMIIKVKIHVLIKYMSSFSSIVMNSGARMNILMIIKVKIHVLIKYMSSFSSIVMNCTQYIVINVH